MFDVIKMLKIKPAAYTDIYTGLTRCTKWSKKVSHCKKPANEIRFCSLNGLNKCSFLPRFALESYKIHCQNILWIKLHVKFL